MAVAERLDLAPEAAAARAEVKVPVGVKLSYSLGQVVESGYLAVNAFVFFYYTAVLGLPGKTVGAAVAISMVLDALADPLFGAWSDRLRSRLGRRLPLMLIGAPLTMVTMGLWFSPPAGMAPYLMFFWLMLTKMGVRAFASMFNIPYFALGAELSDGYVERSKIVSWRLLAGLVVTVVITALGFSLFFAGEGGLQKPDRYPAFGWTIAALVLVGALLCCAGVWRYAARLPQPKASPDAVGRDFFSGLAEMSRNRSFWVLFISMLFFTSAAGVSQALNNHAYVFVWKLRPEAIQSLTYIFLFGIFLGVPLTPLMLRWVEKKTASVIGFMLVVGAWVFVPGLRTAGIIMPEGAEALSWLLPNLLVLGIGSGIIFIAYPAMMADAADEHEHIFGVRREGLYFAGLGFAGKAAGGMGTFIGGFALDLLHFPREAGRAVHAVIDPDVLSGLTAAWALVPALLSLAGVAVFLPYNLNRRRHQAIAADIRARREAALSG